MQCQIGDNVLNQDGGRVGFERQKILCLTADGVRADQWERGVHRVRGGIQRINPIDKPDEDRGRGI